MESMVSVTIVRWEAGTQHRVMDRQRNDAFCLQRQDDFDHDLAFNEIGHRVRDRDGTGP